MPKLNDAQWSIKRNHIIEVAFSQFALKGYSRVSVNDIIKEATISKGAFYTYFSSKQEIFFAIVAQSDAQKSFLSAEIESTLSPTERVSAYLRRRLKHFFDPEVIRWIKFSFEFWTQAEMTKEMKILNDARYSAFCEDIKSILLDGIESGDFVFRQDIDDVVYVIMSMIDGIASMTAVLEQPLNEQRVDVAVQMVQSYLRNCERIG